MIIIDKLWLPYQSLNRVILVHLWMRNVKELLKIWKIFLILMVRKGNWCCVLVWRIYHLFVTKMNKFTLENLLVSMESTAVILSTSTMKEWIVCFNGFKPSYDLVQIKMTKSTLLTVFFNGNISWIKNAANIKSNFGGGFLIEN